MKIKWGNRERVRLKGIFKKAEAEYLEAREIFREYARIQKNVNKALEISNRFKLSAPFPGMKEPWSQEDIDRLQAALKTMRPPAIPPMVNPIDWKTEYIAEYIADEKRDLLNEVNSEIKLDDTLDD